MIFPQIINKLMEVPKRIGPYSVYGTLGSGGYGQVLAVRDPKTLQNFAMKISEDKQSLQKEYKILKTLSKCEDFMKVFEFGSIDNFDFILMELFGKNLQYRDNDYIYSIKCVAAVGLEILNRIEKMHNLDIIHRDIKPSQCLLTSDKKKVFLVDFGLSTFFKIEGKHRVFKNKCRFKGSVIFSSINTHLGFRHSRRDDLESLSYTLLYMIRGNLPWHIDEKLDNHRNIKLILNQKLNIKRDYLFREVPAEFESFFKYTRKLMYDQTPNYSYLKSLLSKFANSEPLHFNFDWIVESEFFSKYTSKVEIKDKLPVLYVKNCNGEFISKRRNGTIEFNAFRKLSKSFDVHDLEEIRKKTAESELRSKKSRSKSSKAKKTEVHLKIDDFLNSHSPSASMEIFEMKANSFSIQEKPSQSSFLSDDGEETSRSKLPEFENRKQIIDSRKIFINSTKRKSADARCLII
jgi:serine/threonine protein kinase